MSINGKRSIKDDGSVGQSNSGGVTPGGAAKSKGKGPAAASAAKSAGGQSNASTKELAARVKRLSQVAGGLGKAGGSSSSGQTSKDGSKGSQKPLHGGSQHGTGANRGGGPSGDSRNAVKSKMVAGGSKNEPALFRVYTDGKGKEVTRARMVNSNAPFEQRINKVKSKTFAATAVGLAESSVYHGSESLERDFIKGAKRGTRVAGHQLLRTVSTVDAIAGEGRRIRSRMVSPAAMGGRLGYLASAFEQFKVNHFKVIYKPVVAATVPGAIAIAFENDTGIPGTEIGADVLQKYSMFENFTDTTVWTCDELDVDPSAINVKYSTDSNTEPGEGCQGRITVLSSSALTANTTYGHIYLEYDFEFWAPKLDLSVAEDNEVSFSLRSLTYVAAGDGALIYYSFLVSPSAGNPPRVLFASALPDNAAHMYYGEVVTKALTGNDVSWETPENTGAEIFEVGQTLFFRWNGSSDTFTDGTMALSVFADYNSAMSAQTFDVDEAPFQYTNGQLLYSGDQTTGNLVIFIRAEMINLDDNVE